jgi:hypothetical protein
VPYPDPYLDPFQPTWLGGGFAPNEPQPLFPDVQATVDGLTPEQAPPEQAPSIDAGAMFDPALAAPMPQDPGPAPIDPYEQAPEMQAPPAEMVPGLGIPAEMFDQAAEAAPGMMPDDGRGPGLPLEYVSEGEHDRAAQLMAVHDPIGFSELQAKHDLAQQNYMAAQSLEASQENLRRVEQNLQARQAASAETARKMADLDMQAAEISTRKIDTNRYWRTRSTGQKLATLIGAIAGGASAGTGGRDTFMPDLMRTIDQDIDAQKFDIENERAGINQRRGIVAEEYSRTGDLYQAAEAARLAGYAGARDQIMAQAQLFDPRGTRALALGRAAQDITGRMAASRAAAEAADFERRLKIYEHNRKAEEHAAKMAKAAAAVGRGGGSTKPRPIALPFDAWMKDNKVTHAGEDARAAYSQYQQNVARDIARWESSSKGGAGGAGGAAAAPAFGSSIPFLDPATGQPIQPQAAPQAMQFGGAPAPAAQGRPTSARQSAPAAATTTPEAAPAAVEAAPARKYKSDSDWFAENAPDVPASDKGDYWFIDGKHGAEVDPIKIGKGEDAAKFQQRYRLRQQGAEKVSQLLEMTKKLQKRGLGDKVLWSRVDFKNDKDVQEALSLYQQVAGDVLKSLEWGVPSEGEFKRVQKIMGGEPNRWQDPTPALQRLRETMQDEMDNDFRIYAPAAAPEGVDGKKYIPYRQIRNARPEWVEKYINRGAVKVQAPEYGSTDPKQLKPQSAPGGAPDVEGAAAAKTRETRLRAGDAFAEAAGHAPVKVGGMSRAQEGPLALEEEPPRPLPQTQDFKYQGAPEGRKAFDTLSTQFTAAVKNVDLYRNGKDEFWKGFETSKKLMRSAVADVLRANPHLAEKYDSEIRAKPSGYDDAELARIAAEILRSGAE